MINKINNIWDVDKRYTNFIVYDDASFIKKEKALIYMKTHKIDEIFETIMNSILMDCDLLMIYIHELEYDDELRSGAGVKNVIDIIGSFHEKLIEIGMLFGWINKDSDFTFNRDLLLTTPLFTISRFSGYFNMSKREIKFLESNPFDEIFCLIEILHTMIDTMLPTPRNVSLYRYLFNTLSDSYVNYKLTKMKKHIETWRKRYISHHALSMVDKLYGQLYQMGMNNNINIDISYFRLLDEWYFDMVGVLYRSIILDSRNHTDQAVSHDFKEVFNIFKDIRCGRESQKPVVHIEIDYDKCAQELSIYSKRQEKTYKQICDKLSIINNK